jgi:hypothetical protein
LYRKTDRHGLPNVMLDQRSGCLACSPASIRRLSTPSHSMQLSSSIWYGSRQSLYFHQTQITTARPCGQLTNRGNQSERWYVLRHGSDIWSKRLRFALTCENLSIFFPCKRVSKLGKDVSRAPLKQTLTHCGSTHAKCAMVGSLRQRYVPWTFRDGD